MPRVNASSFALAVTALATLPFQISMPHGLVQHPSMLASELGSSVTSVLQAMILEHEVLLIAGLT